jgi:hypothetical protein
MSNTNNSLGSAESRGLPKTGLVSERLLARMLDALEIGPDFFGFCPSCAARNVTATKRPRGRPQVIPDERKAVALKAKGNGATNKAVASILYEIARPTRQQSKNVTAILKHYRKHSKA